MQSLEFYLNTDRMLDFFTKSVSKFFGTKSDRDLKTIQPIVEQILVEYPKLASLTKKLILLNFAAS